jgi:hypothetical protein
MTVAKLKGGRDRMRRVSGKCEGRKSYAERAPEIAKRTLREVPAELAARGYVTPSRKPYSASAVARHGFDTLKRGGEGEP